MKFKSDKQRKAVMLKTRIKNGTSHAKRKTISTIRKAKTKSKNFVDKHFTNKLTF